MIVPQLYAWKGPKWVRGIEYLAADRRGFWEERGYHNRAIRGRSSATPTRSAPATAHRSNPAGRRRYRLASRTTRPPLGCWLPGPGFC